MPDHSELSATVDPLLHSLYTCLTMPQVTEWEFTGDIASRLNHLLASRPDLPFVEARVEMRQVGRTKRRDLTLLGKDGRPVLTGEVKMPDRPDGRSPYQQGVVEDAHRKANAVGVEYNFTWNVNDFVLWKTFERGKPITDRSLAHWDVLPSPIHAGDEVTHPRVQAQIDEFLLAFLEQFAGMLSGERPMAWLVLDAKFIAIYESSLKSPVRLTLDALSRRYLSDPRFTASLDKWMKGQDWIPSKDEAVVRENLERAAKFSCYDVANKIVFYKALRKRFSRLRALKIPKSITTGGDLKTHLFDLFAEAVRVTSDYETVFQSTFGDELPFLNDVAVDSWRDLSENTDGFDFTQLNHEIIGLIFERLLSTEERHKYGQHYTRSEVVDLINAFCIRKPTARVLDPACGGGTFLVRAYALKKALSQGQLAHRDLIQQLYGFDISAYPVHLTTINLVTRDLIDAANYPQVARRDFFDVIPHDTPFLMPFSGPDAPSTLEPIGKVDAVVGNPPYVRQEKIGEYYGADYKRKLQELGRKEAPGANLSGRSDLHVYFFAHAATFLENGGYLGLLTSSAWLDTAYGFRLQKFLLDHFEIIAIFESATEPWFTGARVTTAATILRKQPDPAKRAANVVHFVKIRRELSEMLVGHEDDDARRRFFERLRDHIERLTQDETTDDWRVRCIQQGDLYKLGQMAIEGGEGEDDEEDGDGPKAVREASGQYRVGEPTDNYVGYKCGIFLRAPDIFFKLRDRAREALVPLGEIANIKRGVTSGADDFFYPVDITDEELKRLPSREFKELYGIRPSDTQKIRVVRAGDGSAHLIEARFLEPVVFNLMEIDSVRIRPANLKRKILICPQSKAELRKQGATRVLSYIRWGENEGFHLRPTCANRKRWYDLTGGKRGAMFWSKTQQYRHVVPLNNQQLICNCNLYDVIPEEEVGDTLLCAVLNSTPVALSKQFFGRFAGREGALKTEIVDVNMMLAPDPRRADNTIAKRLRDAVASMRRREALPLVDVDAEGDAWTGELAMPDRQELDDAVLELLGFTNRRERGALRAELYAEMTRLYREIRATEKKMQKFRAAAARQGRPSPVSVADEVWESFAPKPAARTLADFVPAKAGRETIRLPAGKPKATGADMFNPYSLQFGGQFVPLESPERVEYALRLAESGISGEVAIPTDPAVCARAVRAYDEHVAALNDQFATAAAAFTADEKMRERIVRELCKRATLAKG
ncbi:MAG TPA: N-6 DNA methylase [Anaerolineae bacterium]|nr:N-6 DNA methylase [Anaerolineae bacterium]